MDSSRHGGTGMTLLRPSTGSGLRGGRHHIRLRLRRGKAKMDSRLRGNDNAWCITADYYVAYHSLWGNDTDVAQNDGYFEFSALSLRMRLMHLAQAWIRVGVPLIGRVTQCRLGANVRDVFCARFFHCPPATPGWWVCCRPAWVFFVQISHVYAIIFPYKIVKQWYTIPHVAWHHQ